MLWLCFELPSCLFGNTRDTFVMHEKAKFVCLFYLYAIAKSEIQICSNKHETGLVYTVLHILLVLTCNVPGNIYGHIEMVLVI